MTTVPITFYTILDVPNDPWDPANKTESYYDINNNLITTTDNKMQPWVDVLDVITSTTYCQGMNNFTNQLSTIGIAAKITEEINKKFKYDNWRNSHYFSSTGLNVGFSFNLTSFNTQLKAGNARAAANCYDLAWGVVIYSNILGDNLSAMEIHSSPNPDLGFYTNKILRVGEDKTDPLKWETIGWAVHCVAVRSATSVYDACLMLDESSPKLPCGMNWTTYSSLLTSYIIVLDTIPLNKQVWIFQ